MLLNKLMVLVICDESTKQPCRFALANPTFVSLRDHLAREQFRIAEDQMNSREKENQTLKILSKRESTRTEAVPVPETPIEVPDDPEAGSNEPAEPEIADEAEPPLRRSTWTTAGKHGNLHREPCSTVNINALVAFHLVNLILRTLKMYKQF